MRNLLFLPRTTKFILLALLVIHQTGRFVHGLIRFICRRHVEGTENVAFEDETRHFLNTLVDGD